jgi:hypothetical protein
MVSATFVVLLLSPEVLQTSEDLAPPIEKVAQVATRRQLASRIKVGMRGSEVRGLLGLPTKLHLVTLQSAGSWHYCYCEYKHLGIRVTLYAENRVVWAVPEPSFPEDWQVRGVQVFDPRDGRFK